MEKNICGSYREKSVQKNLFKNVSAAIMKKTNEEQKDIKGNNNRSSKMNQTKIIDYLGPASAHIHHSHGESP